MNGISRIESTLAMFKEDVEKEEASAILTYIKLAISGFAASQSVPQRPSISGNLQLLKNNRGNSIKEKHPTAVTATPVTNSPTYESAANTTIFHAMPIKPQSNESSWATGVRKGHKKARTLTNPKVQSPLESSKNQKCDYEGQLTGPSDPLHQLKFMSTM